MAFAKIYSERAKFIALTDILVFAKYTSMGKHFFGAKVETVFLISFSLN